MSTTRNTTADRFYREPETTKPDLLGEIIDRMSVIEAKQSRPSPVKLTTWEDIERFAEKAARSGMVPPHYNNKPDAIVIAVQMGSELGLAPMQALQNIAVIGNRPAIWGDAMPGLCRASGLMRTMREWSEGEGDDMVFYCEAVRKDDPQAVLGAFSVADAIRAALWGKDIWKKYPKRMLQMRARGFCLRDAFPDVLKGLVSVEEAEDMLDTVEDFIPSRRPAGAVSKKTQEAPPEERYPTLFNVPDGKVWLANLEAVLLATKTPKEIADIVTLSSVEDARKNWPSEPVARINKAIESATARVTPSAFLAALRADLDGPLPAEAIDAILAREDVQKAQDIFRNGDKTELDTIIAALVKRAQAIETSAPNEAA